MNDLPAQWRPFIEPLAKVMNLVPQVRWDRCIPLDDLIRIYGWVERPDGRADFVIFESWLVEGRPELNFFTSSPDPELATTIATALGIAINDHVDCQRIEEVFGGMVTNAIKLDDPCDCEAAIEAEKGAGWLRRCTCEDGEKVSCPACGKGWVHICDEAEGCSWVPA